MQQQWSNFFNFPLQRLASSPMQPVWKKTFLTIFVLISEKPSPHRKSDFVPTLSLAFRPSNFTVTTFIEGCSQSDPGWPDAADDCLRRLPESDLVVWTDGSVVRWLRSPLSAVGAGVHEACRRCLFSSSLSYTQLAQSPLDSQLSLLHFIWPGMVSLPS